MTTEKKELEKLYNKKQLEYQSLNNFIIIKYYY